jgi:hypothetical protein
MNANIPVIKALLGKIKDKSHKKKDILIVEVTLAKRGSLSLYLALPERCLKVSDLKTAPFSGGRQRCIVFL